MCQVESPRVTVTRWCGNCEMIICKLCPAAGANISQLQGWIFNYHSVCKCKHCLNIAPGFWPGHRHPCLQLSHYHRNFKKDAASGEPNLKAWKKRKNLGQSACSQSSLRMNKYGSVTAVSIVHRPSPLSRSCSSDGRHTRYLAIAIAGPTVTMLMVNFTLFYTFTSR